MKIQSERSKFLAVVAFAIAFGFVEASVVVYLRHLLGSSFSPPEVSKNQVLVPGVAFLDPKTIVSIIKESNTLLIEQFREAATMVMLGSVAYLAGRKWLTRLAYFLLAFGVWDIFYYLFLRLIIGWPKSLFDSDVLFLLPVPWVGPVITPVVASLVMIAVSLLFIKRRENYEQ